MVRATDSTGLLVGAVGIENNTDWNFRDLEEMLRSAKALKRNNREREGILIGPSKAPRFSRSLRFRHCGFFTHGTDRNAGFGPKFRGADGKPTNETALRGYENELSGYPSVQHYIADHTGIHFSDYPTSSEIESSAPP